MDGDSSRKENSTKASNTEPDGGSFFQSLWIRYSSILADASNWEFMESQLCYVLYSGTILWIVYLLAPHS